MLKPDNKIKPDAKMLEEFSPIVMFTRDTIHKMELYIEGCTDEIGWLCAAKRNEEGNVIVYDAFLFKQDVHATTTEITPEGLSEFAMTLLELPNGMELWNDIRAWGHSHVRMATHPSGQDDAQMLEFQKSGFPWMVRIIGNKLGSMRVDLYDYEKRIRYNNLPWEVILTPEEEEIQAQIDALYSVLDALEVGRKPELKVSIDAEIKEKVKKKSWNNSNVVYGKGATPQSNWDARHNPSAGTHHPQQTSLPIMEEDVKKNVGTAVGSIQGAERVGMELKENPNEERKVLELVGGSSDIDIIYNINTQFYKYFTYADAWDIASIEDLDELEMEIWESYGTHIQFSRSDLRKIQAHARSITHHFNGGY